MKRIFTLLVLTASFFPLNAQPSCPDDESSIIVSILTDDYGYETSWEVKGSSGIVYGGVEPDTYANNALFETQVCVPAGECVTFTIFDSFDDGIFLPGYYLATLDGDTVASGGNFAGHEFSNFNCAPGEVCTTAVPVMTGTYVSGFDDHWYSFSPDSIGIYLISTCGLNDCDTKIWVYDTCEGNGFEEDNQGTVFFDDDQSDCAPQAMIRAFLEPEKTYLIRIGDNEDACADSIRWKIVFEGPVTGCTDPTSCNYSPLATIDDGSCLPQSHPDCPDGPDLKVSQEVFSTSIYLDQIDATDECLIESGCLKGYGQRQILRFSTRIDNIGEKDYYIGEPLEDNSQFSYDNCHNHFHYDGYAEYILFDEQGNQNPIGFKSGFCVIDLGCTAGSAQYGCNNMGISAGCWDEYWAELECQWIDLTDVPDGNYTFVIRVNWDNAPDALGQLEKDTINNWAQLCLTIDRSSGPLEVVLEEDCEPYTDCEGTLYGPALIDCDGVCNGGAIRGNLDGNDTLDLHDAQTYVMLMLENEIEAATCNDLNADEQITVYDAALLANCLNGAEHDHTGGDGQDHCYFPTGIVNVLDTVTLSILDFNAEEQYFDIGISNPSAYINAYQFRMSGIAVINVENLVDPAAYPITPQSNTGEGMIIGISYEDSLITKSPVLQPLCRVYYQEITSTFICIDSIFDIVNSRYEQVITRIEEGCVEYIPNSVQNLYNTIAVRVQPNPFANSSLLTFQNPGGIPHCLEITGLNGKIVRTFDEIRGTEVHIDRQNLPDGIYFYRLISKSGYAFGKLSIQNK